MRYVIALTVCCMLLGSFLVNHWWVEDSFAIAAREIRETMALPPDAPLTDVAISLPKAVLVGMEIDRFFLRYWFVIVPLTLALCFGVAAFGFRARKPGPAETPR